MKEIINKKNHTKVVIFKQANGLYGFSYYELCNGKYQIISTEHDYSEEVINDYFGGAR